MFTRLQNLQDAALCLVRVVTGYMFLQHGLAKFFEFPVSMTGGHGAVGQMAVAYFFIHGGNVLLPMTNGGELAALYSLMFLLLVFTGGGKYALDAVRAKQ